MITGAAHSSRTRRSSSDLHRSDKNWGPEREFGALSFLSRLSRSRRLAPVALEPRTKARQQLILRQSATRRSRWQIIVEREPVALAHFTGIACIKGGQVHRYANDPR